jgi:hypothetical protein
MAQVEFTPAPVFRTSAPKAKMTIYFVLLIIALFALMIACGFMYAEIRAHGGFGSVQGRVAARERAEPSRSMTLARRASEGFRANSLARASG